jgi:hypothetical protein
VSLVEGDDVSFGALNSEVSKYSYSLSKKWGD